MRLSRFGIAVLFGALGAGIGGTYAGALADMTQSERGHWQSVQEICESPGHFYRQHAASVLPEGCEQAEHRSAEPMGARCSEDAALYWDGLTNDHSLCMAVDALYRVPRAVESGATGRSVARVVRALRERLEDRWTGERYRIGSALGSQLGALVCDLSRDPSFYMSAEPCDQEDR